jgi:hypothetical protein
MKVGEQISEPAGGAAVACGRVPVVWRAAVAAALVALLGACATPTTNSITALGWIDEKGNPPPTLEGFAVCHDYGCASRTAVKLAPEEWQEIRDLFKDEVPDAAEERTRIKQAVAKLEVMAGRQAGTLGDKGGTLNAIALRGQQDCVDEAVNTTTYLVLMENDGLIKRHKAQSVAWRGQLFGKNLPHVTPVMAEIDNGELWAVDSSFFDNGQEPVIMPLKEWLAGWEPPNFQF